MTTLSLTDIMNAIALRVINGEIRLSDIRNQYGSEFAAKIAGLDPRPTRWTRYCTR